MTKGNRTPTSCATNRRATSTPWPPCERLESNQVPPGLHTGALPGELRSLSGGIEPPTPRIKSPVLSQLSYARDSLVRTGGFEPPTSRLSGERSHQLSYVRSRRRLELNQVPGFRRSAHTRSATPPSTGTRTRTLTSSLEGCRPIQLGDASSWGVRDHL